MRVQEIQRVVYNHFDIPRALFLSSARSRKIALPRQIAVWLCRRHCPHASLPMLGKLFGGKDHTTMLHACRRIEWWLRVDSEVAATVSYLDNLISHADLGEVEAPPIPAVIVPPAPPPKPIRAVGMEAEN